MKKFAICMVVMILACFLGGNQVSAQENDTHRGFLVADAGVVQAVGNGGENEAEVEAKALRAKGAQLLREKKQAEALVVYKKSLELQHDPNIEAFVKKLEGMVGKQQAGSKAGLAGEWERVEGKDKGYKFRYESTDGNTYKAYLTETGRLARYGFTVNENTQIVTRQSNTNLFKGKAKWRWTSGGSEWRAYEFELVGNELKNKEGKTTTKRIRLEGMVGEQQSASSATATPKISYALNFNGEDSYVDLTGPLPIFSDSFTISMRVKVPSNAKGRVGVLLGDYNIPGGKNINLEIHNKGQIRFFWNGSPDLYGKIDLRDDQWHFITFVRDKTEGKVIGYVDGDIDINYSGKIGDKNASTPHRIGRDERTGDTAFEGAIREIRIWDTALDQNTIISWMNKEPGSNHPNYSNLVSWFSFATQEDTIVDSIGSNNGTVSGAHWTDGTTE